MGQYGQTPLATAGLLVSPSIWIRYFIYTARLNIFHLSTNIAVSVV